MKDAPARAGALAALVWALLCVRWFDAGAPFRPAWLGAVPPIVLLLAFLVALGVWLRGRFQTLRGEPLGPAVGGLVLVLAGSRSRGAAPAPP